MSADHPPSDRETLREYERLIRDYLDFACRVCGGETVAWITRKHEWLGRLASMRRRVVVALCRAGVGVERAEAAVAAVSRAAAAFRPDDGGCGVPADALLCAAMHDPRQLLADLAAAREAASPALTDDEYTILRALRAASPLLVLMCDLAAVTGIGRKTCGAVVESLSRRGLAVRRDERRGAAVTPAGRSLLEAAERPRR
jgi:DNA-binding MarR family transcriptional regulator